MTEDVHDPGIGTRVISVVLRPDELPGTWELTVDFAEWISPWEAYALLKAGQAQLEDRLGLSVDDEEGQ